MFTGMLNNKCDIYKRKITGKTSLGEKKFSYEKVAEDIPCAFQPQSQINNPLNRLAAAEKGNFLYIVNNLGFKLNAADFEVEVDCQRWKIEQPEDMGGRGRYLALSLSLITTEKV